MSDLAPNIGMWWYFFTEMFDHFRNFFLGVFQVGSILDSPILAMNEFFSTVSHPHIRGSGMPATSR